MSPRRLSDLDPRERRRAIAVTALVIVAVWIALIAGYYLLPLDSGSGLPPLLRLGLAIAVFAVAIVLQARRIVRSTLPQLRAARALGSLIPLFLVLFSAFYLSMSHASTSHFNEPLDHTDALYFTVTVFSSVGLGDIHPIGGPARILVSLQMLLDLVILGVLVRVLVRVTKSALATADSPSGDDQDELRGGPDQ
jgi:voltage-gated potassium channel